MDLEHKLTLLIQGKNLLGDKLKDAAEQVKDVGDAADEASEKASKLDKLEEWLGGALGNLKDFGESVSGVFQLLMNLLKGLLGLVKKVVLAFSALGAAFVGLGAVTAQYAAKLESAERTFQAIHGDAAPKMLQALRENSAFMLSDLRLQEQYVQSYMLTGKVLSDRLPEAYRYMSKVAVATHEDVDFLVERLYRSVGRLSTRWMAYVGTVVEKNEAMQHAVEMYGKEEEAISRTELQAAMLDRVLEKLAARTMDMPEALGTSHQMFTALKVAVQNLAGEYGKHFLPIAREVVRTFLHIIRTATSVISKGGALYDTFRLWSAGTTVLAESFGSLIRNLADADGKFFEIINSWGYKLARFSFKTFSWGMKISTQLAAGIVKGASTALVAAMNFITSLLTHWLKPMSPPLVAPEIDEWGAATMEEYLLGFTQASFDSLEGVQDKLEAVLTGFISMDWITEAESAQAFLEITEQFSEGLLNLQDVGSVLEEAFEKLGNVGAGFGEHLVEYAKSQIRVAEATERLERATRDLKAAKIELAAADKDLARVTDEYNMMLLEEAGYYELRSKREDVRAARARKRNAEAAKQAAEEEKATAQEQLDIYEERLALQGRLLDQLVRLLEKQAQLQEGGAGGAGGSGADAGAGAGGGLGDILEPIVPEPLSGIGVDQAFEDLKDRIRQKFQDLWDELAEIWAESDAGKAIQDFRDALARLQGFLDTNKDTIVTKVAEIAGPVYKWFRDDIFGWVLGEWEKWEDWWGTDSEDVTNAAGKFGYWVGKAIYMGLGAWLPLVQIRVENSKRSIEETLSATRLVISLSSDAIQGDWEGVKETFGTWSAEENAYLQGVNNSIITFLNNLAEEHLPELDATLVEWEWHFKSTSSGIKDSLDEIGRKLGITPITDLLAFEADWKVSWTNIKDRLNQVSIPITEKLEVIADWFLIELPNGLERTRVKWVDETFPEIRDVTETIWEENILPVFENLKEWWEDTLVEALEKFRSWFEVKILNVQSNLDKLQLKWNRFVNAVKGFWRWLKNRVFKFDFDGSSLPAWGEAHSPIPLHTAWKDFGDFLDSRTFTFDMDLPGVPFGSRGQPSPVMAAGNKTTIINIRNLSLPDVPDASSLIRELQRVSY